MRVEGGGQEASGGMSELMGGREGGGEKGGGREEGGGGKEMEGISGRRRSTWRTGGEHGLERGRDVRLLAGRGRTSRALGDVVPRVAVSTAQG